MRLRVAPAAERAFQGHVYRSKAESTYAAVLELRKKAGDIIGWRRATPQPLIVNGYKVGVYTADFVVEHPDHSTETIEVKGAWTDLCRLRVRLFLACYPGTRLTCLQLNWGKWFTLETPMPKPPA